MLMMDVGRVVVLVFDRLVAMRVGVLSCKRRHVLVIVMAVVVAVRMVVLDRFVKMPVRVTFGQVKPNANPER